MKKFMFAALGCLLMITGCASTPPQLGVNNGQLTPCQDKPNCVNSFASNEEQYVTPMQHTGTAPEIRNNLLALLKKIPNSVVTVTEANYVRAEFTSKVFSFVDDVEFYFPDSDSTETTIHLRSASRVGYSDFGVNRKRIEQIRNQFMTLNE